MNMSFYPKIQYSSFMVSDLSWQSTKIKKIEKHSLQLWETPGLTPVTLVQAETNKLCLEKNECKHNNDFQWFSDPLFIGPNVHRQKNPTRNPWGTCSLGPASARQMNLTLLLPVPRILSNRYLYSKPRIWGIWSFH